jgi:transcriptional regulator with XRE-family HTH domain
MVQIFMTLHERLKAERERLGLSQPRVAELLGVGKTTVINWEKGASAPDAVQLAAFAAAGADVLYVLTGQHTGSAPAPAPLSKEEKAVLREYHEADAEGRAVARRILTSSPEGKKPSPSGFGALGSLAVASGLLGKRHT